MLPFTGWRSTATFTKVANESTDGRRRQYIAITDEGRVYVDRLIKAYAVVSKGVQEVFGERRTGEWLMA